MWLSIKLKDKIIDTEPTLRHEYKANEQKIGYLVYGRLHVEVCDQLTEYHAEEERCSL